MKEEMQSRILSVIKEHCWNYWVFSDCIAVEAFSKKEFRWLKYNISLEETGFSLAVNAPVGTSGKGKNLLPLINQLNGIVKDGHFHLDSEGLVSYRCFVRSDGKASSEELIREVLMLPVRLFNRYGLAFLEAIVLDAKEEESAEEPEYILSSDEELPF